MSIKLNVAEIDLLLENLFDACANMLAAFCALVENEFNKKNSAIINNDVIRFI